VVTASLVGVKALVFSSGLLELNYHKKYTRRAGIQDVLMCVAVRGIQQCVSCLPV